MELCPRSCSFRRAFLSQRYRWTGLKSPLRRGFPRAANTDFDFCRFCHFRVLTPKKVSHITRLADDEGLAARRAANSGKGRGAAGQPEEPSCSPKLGSPASTDVALERGSRGLLFDIVKMEERETWTARFLRSDREIGHTDFDGTFSQEVHTTKQRGSPR